MKKALLVVTAALGLVVIASVAIWQASGDDSRRQGALGSEEPVSLSWHGEWSTEAAYAPGNVVNYDGTSYVAESEKLSTPTPDCLGCGWIALEGASTETKEEEAAPTVPTVRGYETASRDVNVPASTAGVGFTVSCPSGKMPLGGGGKAVPPAHVTGMSPGSVTTNADGTQTGSWTLWFENPVAEARSASLHVVCANVS